jgi:hypothetical protein
MLVWKRRFFNDFSKLRYPPLAAFLHSSLRRTAKKNSPPDYSGTLSALHSWSILYYNDIFFHLFGEHSGNPVLCTWHYKCAFPIEASPNVGTSALKWLIVNVKKKFRMIMTIVIASGSLTTNDWPFTSYWQEPSGSPRNLHLRLRHLGTR